MWNVFARYYGNNLLIQSKNTHEVSRKKSEQPMWIARLILVEIKELENSQLSIFKFQLASDLM